MYSTCGRRGTRGIESVSRLPYAITAAEQPDIGKISRSRRRHRYCVQDARHCGVIAYPLTIQHVSHRITAPLPDREPIGTIAIKEHPPDRRYLRCGSTPAHNTSSFL